MKAKIIISILTTTCALISCVSATKVVSTETAVPISTNTQAPTSENTAQVSSDASHELEERLVYEQAGFSFQPIKGYDVIPIEMDKGAQNIILHDEAKSFSIYLYGTKTDSRFESANDVLIFWMPAITKKDPDSVINPISNNPVIVDNVSGIAVNVTGVLLNKPLTGQVVSLWVSKNQYVFVLGFSDAEKHSALWTTEGQKAFDSLVNSIEFSK